MKLDTSSSCLESGSTLRVFKDADAKFCQDREEATAYADELKQQHLLALRTSTNSLRAASNEAHISLIARLPVEIMSHIFELYIDGCRRHWYHAEDGAARSTYFWPWFPLRLGAICRLWRRIAWSLPRIWTSLAVNIRTNGHRHGPELARQWLERSGRHPLSIQVCDRSCRQKTDDDRWKSSTLSLIKVINLFASRWRALTFQGVPSDVLSEIDWENDSNRPSILRHLTIKADYDDRHSGIARYSRIKPICKHHPTHITVESISLKVLNVDWNDIVRFDGGWITSKDCFDVLKQASSLIDCSLSLDHNFPIEQVLQGSVVNATLRKLTISGAYLDDLKLMDFLGALTLPSLQELHYEGCDPSYALVELIEQSCCQLQSIHFSLALLQGDMLVDIFQSTPALKTLVVSWCDEYDSHLFENLSMTTPGSSEPLLLPHLKSLQITISTIESWKSVAKIYGDINIGIGRVTQSAWQYPSRRQSLKFDLLYHPGPSSRKHHIDSASLLHFMQVAQDPGLTIRCRVPYDSGYGYIDFIEESLRFQLSSDRREPELALLHKMVDNHPLLLPKVD